MTTIDELKETAALAHLNLDENELAAMLPAFEQMLEYFSVMNNAEEDCAAFPLGLGDSNNPPPVNTGFFRPDTADNFPDYKNLINNADGRDGQFIVIPNVL